MDLCSLEDAFPNIELRPGNKSYPNVGGKDSIPSREERRAARKKAKKAKGPALAYSESVAADIPETDPDRPAMKRMEPVAPVTETFSDVIPVLPKASCMFSDTGTPKYFGKGVDDDEEGFATYSASPSDDANYRLYPDFTQGDALKGVEKAASKVLPDPPTDDAWKPITPAASYTAFHKELTPHVIRPENVGSYVETLPEWAAKGSGSLKRETVEPANEYNQSEKQALLARIDMLMTRLDQLEKKTMKDSQTEMLLFVGTGVFLLASLEFLTRR